MGVFTPRNFWFGELGKSLNFQNSYRQLESHSTCPGSESALGTLGPNRKFLGAQVHSERRCIGLPALWAPAACGSIFETGGDCCLFTDCAECRCVSVHLWAHGRPAN